MLFWLVLELSKQIVTVSARSRFSPNESGFSDAVVRCFVLSIFFLRCSVNIHSVRGIRRIEQKFKAALHFKVSKLLRGTARLILKNVFRKASLLMHCITCQVLSLLCSGQQIKCFWWSNTRHVLFKQQVSHKFFRSNHLKKITLSMFKATWIHQCINIDVNLPGSAPLCFNVEKRIILRTMLQLV